MFVFLWKLYIYLTKFKTLNGEWRTVELGTENASCNPSGNASGNALGELWEMPSGFWSLLFYIKFNTESFGSESMLILI